MVHHPLSPHKKSNAPFRGIFCWDCLQSLLCKGRTTKNEEGEAPHLIFYVTPSLRDHSIIPYQTTKNEKGEAR